MQAPHSLEAEKAVIGSVMLDHTLLDKLHYLPPEAFYAERHRILWTAMAKLVASGRDPDNVTLIDHLRTANQLDRVGSVPYVMALPDETPTAAYAHQYAATVLEHHKRRQLISLCERTAHAAASDDLTTALGQHEITLTTLASQHHLQRGPHDYHREALDLITGRNAASTGFPELDGPLGGGLTRGGYNVIAARPGMGKSALLRRIVTHRAEEGETVSYFSIDQGGGEVYAFEAALKSGVPVSHFRPDRHGYVRASPTDRQSFQAALDHIRDVWSERVHLHDSRADLEGILAQARADIRNGATLIAIDHAQAILVDGKSDETNLVARVSRTMKALCREHNVTLVLLSQLGRGVESRDDKRPTLRDLRQSGAIEEDANLVVFLYRDDYYRAQTDPMHTPTNDAEVHVAKNKLGPTPQIAKLLWRQEFVAFASRAQQASKNPMGAN